MELDSGPKRGDRGWQVLHRTRVARVVERLVYLRAFLEEQERTARMNAIIIMMHVMLHRAPSSGGTSTLRQYTAMTARPSWSKAAVSG